MFDTIVSFFRSLFSDDAQQRVAIPVRTERKRDLLNPRR